MAVVFLAGLSALSAALAVVVYHFAVVRRRLLAIDPVVAQARAALEGEPSGDPVALGAFVKRSEERLTELERVCRDQVFRVGFVRYNSLPTSAQTFRTRSPCSTHRVTESYSPASSREKGRGHSGNRFAGLPPSKMHRTRSNSRLNLRAQGKSILSHASETPAGHGGPPVSE